MTGATPAAGHPIAASVVIPTRNRCEILAKAVASALAQSVPVEVIVLDDGSTDDTPQVIRRQFPRVRYERFEGPKGPSFLRNRGTELARSAIVFPIDDDSVFASEKTIEQTIREFDHPRVGAVGIPFVNVRQDQSVHQMTPDDTRMYVTHAYVGAAHALRRDLFLYLGGYREHFFYMGEEGDFCLRMLDAGYVVRLGRADPVHHFESPARNLERADTYGRRNDVLFAWHNTPLSSLIPQMTATAVKGAFFGVKVGRPWWAMRGLVSGYIGCARHARERRPVSRESYRLFRELKRSGATPFESIEARLPKRQS